MVNLKLVDKNLYKIGRGIKMLPWLIPLNLLSEKGKFFKSGFDYNPRFFYKKSKLDFEKEKQCLGSLELKNGWLEKMLKNKIKELKRQIELVEFIGADNFSEKSILLYGKPSKFLANVAKSELKDFRTAQHLKNLSPLGPNEVADELRKRLVEYGLLNWRVGIAKKTASRISVRNEINVIKIRKDALFNKKELGCLIAHEIYTHIFRKENGRYQPFKLFQQGTANHTSTEEGLAVYNEKLLYKKTCSPYHDYRIFIRTLAVDWALKHSFKQVFLRLLSLGLDPESCWDTALRVKRGLADTSRPGAFTKDYLYLKGYLGLKNFVKSGGDIKKLYIGKIGLDDLAFLQQASIAPPKFLPRWLLGISRV